MLNSANYEILNAHKYKNIKKFSIFVDSDKPRMLLFLQINVKMPTKAGILTFMRRKYLMLTLAEHENSGEHKKTIITSGQDLSLSCHCICIYYANHFSSCIHITNTCHWLKCSANLGSSPCEKMGIDQKHLFQHLPCQAPSDLMLFLEYYTAKQPF